MTENNENRLEVNILTNYNKMISQAKIANAQLGKTAENLRVAKVILDKMGNVKSLILVNDETEKIAKNTQQMQNNLSKFSKALSSSFNIGKLYLLWNVTKRIRDTIGGWINASVDFIETTNKFEVAMGKATDKAYTFQKKLADAFGTVTTEMMNYQSTFKNIMSSLPGLTNDAAEKVSETLVKLGLDYSSLYNVNQGTAMSRIQSALVGSVKPIRSDAGYDITEATIAMKASNLGITTSVRNLNQMEKRLLRIIVLMDQMRNTGAMQDLARTIEQPANQIKILKNQVQELGVWLGNVFIGTIGRILPYINGFVMALVAIVKTLAVFVGYTNVGSGLAEGLEVADDAAQGIASGVGGAAKSAKELRKALMGFDVLNVIQKPSDSSGGGGGGGSPSLNAVNPAILAALKDYDNLMDSVRMKAIDIRDKIMDWLGFIKVINPLTGDTTWKLRNGWTNLKKIGAIIQGLIGLNLFIKLTKLIGGFKNFFNILKTGKSTGLTPFVSGATGLKNILANLGTSISSAFTYFKYYKSLGASTGEAFLEASKQGLGLLSTTTKLIGGIGGLALSIYGAYDSMKDFSEGTKSAGRAFTELGVSIGGAAASGALLGSVIPGIGTALGAIAGALIGAGAAVLGYRTEEEKLADQILKNVDARQKYRESLEETNKAIEDTVNSQLAQVQYTQNLVDELNTLVDANGRVKEGYEARVNFILTELNKAYGTQYKLIDGEIQNYKELKTSIDNVIKSKKAEILLNANEAKYAKAIEERAKLYAKLEESSNDAATAQQEYEKALKNWGLTLEDAENQTAKYVVTTGTFNIIESRKLDKLRTAYKQTKNDLKESAKAYENNNKTIIYWEDLKTATLEGDQKKVDEAIKKSTTTYQTEAGEQQLTLAQQLREEKKYYEQRLQELKTADDDITEETERTYASVYDTVVDSLVAQTNAVNVYSPEISEAWKQLATDNVEEYKKRLSSLDPDLQTAIQKSTGVIVNELGNAKPNISAKVAEVSNIIKELGNDFKFQPKIDINPQVALKVSNLKTKLEGLKNALSAAGGLIPTVATGSLDVVIKRLDALGYANGGFPDMGELFVAREAGPELVGSIGNRNAVMNNEQIVEAVSSGVANAVASVMGNNGSSFQLIIDGEQITDVVQRRLARRANITGMAMGV